MMFIFLLSKINWITTILRSHFVFSIELKFLHLYPFRNLFYKKLLYEWTIFLGTEIHCLSANDTIVDTLTIPMV